MKLKIFTALSILLTSTLVANDIVEPTTKKEVVKALPHVWISGGLLCLKATENRADFANRPQEVATASNYTTGAIIKPHFAWDCGVKIELGLQPKDWFFFANWTHIVNRAHGNLSTTAAEGFFPVWSHDSALTENDFVTSAHMEWDLNTQIVDVGSMLSWEFGKVFILKAHGAIRTAFFDQEFKIEYGGGVFDEGIDTINMKNNFFGVGPAIGLSPNILLGKGFSIIGDIEGAALLGQFFIKQREKYLTDSLFSETDFLARMRFNIDAKVAISWQTEFLYKALVFSVQTGLEWHKYYDQNQLHQNDFAFFNNKRNLIMRGGFLTLTLGF